jgi:serine O-acetyltransferase
MKTLLIRAGSIGEGLFINHGFCTAIGAKSIGKNCKNGHQVTIGNYEGGSPIILDNVTIHPAAVIFGDLTIGNNTVIGANATVFQDVPDNSTVYPSSIKMTWNKKDKQVDSDNKVNNYTW